MLGPEELASTAQNDERRTFKRHALKLNKIFSAEILTNGDALPCYLYIVDISDGGVKITSDYTFPQEGPVRVKFYLDEPVSVQVRVVWQKMLEGGTNVYGLQFIDMSPSESDTIRAFMYKYSPEARRKNFRLNRVIYVEYPDSQVAGRQYTFALDLNAQGMRVVSEVELPEQTAVQMRLFLDPDRPPLELAGTVTAVKAATLDRHQMDIAFSDVSREACGRIDAYLDRAMSGELDSTTLRLPPNQENG